MKKYHVTCLQCNGSNAVYIEEVIPNEFSIDLNKDHKNNPIFIISGRYRGDMQFGWECRCGNTSILCQQELHDVDKLVMQGSKLAVDRLTESLKLPDEKKFVIKEG